MTKSATPCYSYGTYGTNPANWPAGWDSDYNNQVNIACDWLQTAFVYLLNGMDVRSPLGKSEP
jgi:hypothetical protein